MKVYLIASLLLYTFVCTQSSKLSKGEKKLLKFKNDVDKISEDLENFAYDIAKEVVKNSELYVDPEYDYEDYDAEYTTEKTTPNYVKDNGIVKGHNQIPATVHNKTSEMTNKTTVRPPSRTKRSFNTHRPEYSGNSTDGNRVGAKAYDEQCYHKSKEEQQLEQLHIEDLKREINHLYDLVTILRDQQKILSVLDEQKDGDIAQSSDSKELLRVLNHLNNDPDKPYSTHHELAKLKRDLSAAISALEGTKDVLEQNRRKEVALEAELKHQKKELELLEATIQRMQLNITNTQTSNDTLLVGSPQHLPKTLAAADTTRAAAREARVHKNARDDALNVLARLLNKFPQSRKSKLVDLEQLEKQVEEAKFKEEFRKLREIIASLPEDDASEKSRQLGTDDEEDVEAELRKLQIAIERLRPKEEVEGFRGEPLRDIFGGLEPKGTGGEVKLNQQQLLELRKKLDKMIAMDATRSGPPPTRVEPPNFPPPYPLWYGPYRPAEPYSNMQGPFGYNPHYPYLGDFQANRFQHSGNRFFPVYPTAAQVPEDLGPGDQGYPGARPPTDFRPDEVDELRLQIESLQSVIDGLNRANYGNRPEDQATVADLEAQIDELKGIVHSLNQDVAPPVQPIQPPQPPKPSAPTFPSYPQRFDQRLPPPRNEPPPMEPHRVARRAASLPFESYRAASLPDQASGKDSQLLDELYSKLKGYFLEDEKVTDGDVEREISRLKAQLDNRHQLYHPNLNQQPTSMSPRTFTQPTSYFYPGYNPVQKLETRSSLLQPKEDLLGSIITKIIDKILALLPKVLEKLLTAIFYGQNGLGYLPLLLLKMLDGLETFVGALKKNKFLKNFLLPALVLLVVAGSVIFLVWWMQDGGDSDRYRRIEYVHPVEQQYGFPNRYDRSGGDFYTEGKYGNRDTGLVPGYSRSYYDEKRKFNWS